MQPRAGSTPGGGATLRCAWYKNYGMITDEDRARRGAQDCTPLDLNNTVAQVPGVCGTGCGSPVFRQSSVTGGRGRNSHNGGEGDSPKCAEDGRDRDAHVHIGLSRAPRGVDNTERGLRTWTQQRGQPLANTALMLRQNETGDGDAPLRSQVLKSSPRSGSCDPSTCRKRLPAEGRLVRQRVAGV